MASGEMRLRIVHHHRVGPQIPAGADRQKALAEVRRPSEPVDKRGRGLPLALLHPVEEVVEQDGRPGQDAMDILHIRCDADLGFGFRLNRVRQWNGFRIRRRTCGYRFRRSQAADPSRASQGFKEQVRVDQVSRVVEWGARFGLRVSLLSKTGTDLATRVANGGFASQELKFCDRGLPLRVSVSCPRSLPSAVGVGLILRSLTGSRRCDPTIICNLA
jgi:hypothetical protein